MGAMQRDYARYIIPQSPDMIERTFGQISCQPDYSVTLRVTRIRSIALKAVRTALDHDEPRNLCLLQYPTYGLYLLLLLIGLTHPAEFHFRLW